MMRVLVAMGVVLLTSAPAVAQLCDQVVAAVVQHARQPAGLEKALEGRPSPNCRAGNGDTPLAMALRFGSAEAVRILLRHGADPNMPAKRSSNQAAPLLSFLSDRAHHVNRPQLGPDSIAYTTSETIVRLLLDAGANIAVEDVGGATALSYAANWGAEPLVRALLSRGADPHKADATGRTPLMYAVCSRNTRVVGLLLAQKANVNARTKDGDSALLYAPRTQNSVAMVKLLLDSGADPLVRNREGVNALLLAARADDLASVQLLLQRGVDPNQTSTAVTPDGRSLEPLDRDQSPLLFAVRHRDEAMVRVLLASGARVRWRDGTGATISDVASASVNDSLAKVLADAERREYSLIPDWPLPERLALVAIKHIASRSPDPKSRQGLDADLLRRIAETADSMYARWTTPKAPRPPVLARSLTRTVNALEWAVENRNNDLLRAVQDDLDTKLQDCVSSQEGLFGEVKVSVRTLRPDNTERRGLQVRYVERFYWDLLDKVPSLANQWREFAAATAVVDEPIPAGDYVMVARSPDGKDLSDAKPISISRNRTNRFDVVVR